MKENPANAIKDTMWKFLMDKGQKSNIPALKEYVYDLIQMTTQKTPERRSHRTEYMRKYRNLNREKIREINRRCRERRKNNDNTSGYEAKEEPS